LNAYNALYSKILRCVYCGAGTRKGSIGADLKSIEEGLALEDATGQSGPADGANQPLPSPEGVPENHAPYADHSSAESKHQPEPSSPFDIAMLRWTRVVAVFTAVLACVGGIQAWAFMQSERASLYVNINSIDPSPILPARPFSVRMTIVNTGRAQAFIVEQKVKIWVGLNLPEKPDLTDIKYTVRGPVPAGGSRYLVNGPLSPTLTGFQIEDIGRGLLKFYIFGYVKFTDDFTFFGPHTIGFCAIYDPAGKSPDGGLPINQCDNPNYTYSE
jgi:hypothetical protein